ncbi:MAG: LPS-assembly protein LptD, partial [Candidatus Latescibacteria bacterium]|nr:LPS-assembly protein LptD [Candidatus Latescibacterota bacterium]
TVHYAAESIDCRFEQDTTIVLVGSAKVVYQDMELQAGKIIYYPGQELLCAEGLPDTSDGELKFIDPPVLRDKGGTTKALSLTYNLKTKRGTLVKARTGYEEGFYTGSRVRKVGEKTLHILRGTYTTCDLNRPHYHFWSRQMKVVMNDKVVAKPVVFYVRKVPVFWLPFIVFSIRKERHSGLLIPRYGSNNIDGRYLHNLGYYFAPSSYWDTMVRGTLREQTGWMLRSELRYHLRGRLRGAITGSFDNRITGTTQRRAWKLGFSHLQTLGPTMNLRGRGDFYSNKDFSVNNSTNIYNRLNRTLRSYLSFHKRWPGSGNSISLTASHSRNLDTDETSLYLPQISFRKARAPILKPPKGKHTLAKWYQLIYYSFSSDFSHLRQERTSGNDNKIKANTYLNISTAQKFRGWLHLRPSVAWRMNGSQTKGEKFHRQESYSFALSANTTLYGFFQPRVGSLKAIRHVVKPSVSFAYSANAEQQGFSYDFGRIKNPQTRVRFNLSNILQTKIGEGKKQRKFNLATWGLSTSYNPRAGVKKFSDLATNVRVSPVRAFEVVLNSTHGFYDPDGEFHPFTPHLKRVNLTTSLRLRGKTGRKTVPAESSPTEGIEEVAGYTSSRVKGTETPPNSRNIPYQFGVSYRYSLVKSTGALTPVVQWIKGNLRFSPTSKWRIDWWVNYNLEKRKITTQQVSIYRDLHCWQSSISFSRSSEETSVFLTFYLTAFPNSKIRMKTKFDQG